jgi:hypothetical protein
VSNGYMVAVLSNFSDKTAMGDDSAAKYKVFVVAQYIIMMLFYVVYTTYSGPSPKSEKLRVKHALVSNQASRDKLLEDIAALGASHGVVPSLGQDHKMVALIADGSNSTSTTSVPTMEAMTQAASVRYDSAPDEDIL